MWKKTDKQRDKQINKKIIDQMNKQINDSEHQKGFIPRPEVGLKDNAASAILIGLYSAHARWKLQQNHVRAILKSNS